ncbi:MAG: GGDEF domain-containing protein [Candidatus Omnitrophica bacterium]|nr:GGDEF domain-containing protein [Candidatus Omnitrophota bacterium]
MKESTFRILLIVGCIFMTLLIAFLNYLAGYEWGFAIFYLVPICVASWYGDLLLGVFTVFCSTTFWLFAETATGHHYSFFLIPYWNACMRGLLFLIISILIHHLKKSLLKEKLFARKDFLTSAANTKAFYESAEMEIIRSQRFKRPFCLAYIDCDNFKQINDRLGHSAGDNFLKEMVLVMNKNVRKTDTVARLGGDEFAILFSEMPGNVAKEIIIRIGRELKEAGKVKKWQATFSIGLISFAIAPSSVDEALKKADGLMYDAKKSGKNRMMLELSPNSREEVVLG